MTVTRIPLDTFLSRFIDFHAEVSVYSERVGWILSKLPRDGEGIDFLEMLHKQLEELLDSVAFVADEVDDVPSTAMLVPSGEESSGLAMTA